MSVQRCPKGSLTLPLLQVTLCVGTEVSLRVTNTTIASGYPLCPYRGVPKGHSHYHCFRLPSVSVQRCPKGSLTLPLLQVTLCVGTEVSQRVTNTTIASGYPLCRYRGVPKGRVIPQNDIQPRELYILLCNKGYRVEGNMCVMLYHCDNESL